MKFSPGYGSHLPVLIKVLQVSEGPVLELGSGPFSTPVIHWLSLETKRPVFTYENNWSYYRLFRAFGYGSHKIKFIEDWDKVPIEAEHWGVAFIDHGPAERRKVDIKRLANIADYIVLHDTDAQRESEYGFIKKSFPLFKYRYDHKRQKPYTSVLSNFIDPLYVLSQI